MRIDKLTTKFQEALSDAQTLALGNDHAYIDPLHLLQVELVRRWRAGQNDDRLKNGIHISINGIAAGLRNTG